MPFRIRSASSDDATAMALVHVGSWRETYRGVVRDEVLDDPAMLERRIAFWRGALADPASAANRVAVAESDGRIRGIAMAGPGTPQQLHLLYTLRELHGTGAARCSTRCSTRAPPSSGWRSAIRAREPSTPSTASPRTASAGATRRSRSVSRAERQAWQRGHQ